MILVASMVFAATIHASAQVPIDLSQALEFRVVWKMPWGGTLIKPVVLDNFCGVAGQQVLVIGSTTRGVSTCRTVPILDTNSIGFWTGVIPSEFDYDGIEPPEYINHGGHVLACERADPPIAMRTLDTIACWGGAFTTLEAEFTADIDGDGFDDLVCDVGGGGYTARVIRGGPNAGRKCERILYVPYAPVANGTNVTNCVTNCLFWRSSSGVYRIMQMECQESRSWVVIYDLRFQTEGNTITTTFTPIDSLTGKGFGGPSHCALVTDTLLKKDWLLMFRFDDDINQNVLERFDATDGMFEPTGERVTGTEFYQPWTISYAMVTSKPVIAYHVPNLGQVLCYADDLAHPFAKILGNDRDVVSTSGYVFINDQTGDGHNDLVLAGGYQNGMVILLSLDSTASTVANSNDPLRQVTARILGTTLEVITTRPVMISAQLVTTDGRMFPTLPLTHGSAGVNRFDLRQALEGHPAGACIMHVRVGDKVIGINFVR